LEVIVSMTSRIFCVEQQVDELRDLDVVDGDLGLTLSADDQVPLRGPVQVQSPRGYAVNAAAGQISLGKIYPN
jgi:hypothetical protein